MILSDKDIRKLCLENGMISPFSEGMSIQGRLSHGLTTSGYDVTLGRGELIAKNHIPSASEDLPHISPKMVSHYGSGMYFRNRYGDSDYLFLESHAFALVRTVESFNMPRNISATCWAKSSLARCGLWVNNTVIEPGWKGVLTLELANLFPYPIKLYYGEGIAQIRFELLSSDPEVSYADKNGIYQDQTGVTASRIR